MWILLGVYMLVCELRYSYTLFKKLNILTSDMITTADKYFTSLGPCNFINLGNEDWLVH